MKQLSVKRILIGALALVTAAGMAACSGDSGPANPAENTSSTAASEEGSGETGSEETVVISHEYGEAEIPVNPQRIVCFDLGVLDILDAVGVEVGAMPSANFPAYLSKFREGYVYVGSMKEADFEGINEYGPDVIIISGRMASAYEELSKIAPTLYLATPGAAYMETFRENVEILAQVFPGKGDEMRSALAEVEAAADALAGDAEASGMKALVMMANDGNISFYGPGSRYGVIHDAFGFAAADDDIEASTHGQEATFEYIRTVNPDVIFVIDRSAAIGSDGATGAAALLDNDLVNATNAAQNGKIIYLSSDIWYLVSGGLDGTVAMIEEVAAALD